ncbi:hypothetical protein [uncultured Methanobacterium sp.]|uniref:hypothetical protein n=1 Tax=uncultured Methanobacterium sp. TaxID=176306 RepID=UPI002AA69626|nr:hypothetical protein [uncultured Methanobacterium sp.]
MISIPEQESRKYIFECIDENGDPVLPEKCIYSLLDVTNDTYIIEETEFIPSTSTITIDITVAQNTIQTGKSTEKRILTFKFKYNGGQDGSVRQETYTIVKLKS